jgi:hypothetical protein
MLLCVTGALASCGAAGPLTVYRLRMAHHCTSSHRCGCTDWRDQSPGRSDSVWLQWHAEMLKEKLTGDRYTENQISISDFFAREQF